jgi:hypothetical protein
MPRTTVHRHNDIAPVRDGAAAVRYALNQWQALTRFLQDGELEIDSGATERANRDIALGRGIRGPKMCSRAFPRTP